jgi:hypothetical protein
VPLASNVLQGFDMLRVNSLEGSDAEIGDFAASVSLDVADERQRRLVPALR